ncbi:CHASE3 domain-containing protein [Methylobacterium currus]|uniref:CHASE3 domain-containing protein n=1 Tax=Methylobacterium currus TaxID=2051553 RepID=UPI001E580070|nr:CHASE3 domain-containing protein [Methylobacterium currus]UHC18810.1 CHASE3 domain-containing protein [Methylobacterium currus]
MIPDSTPSPSARRPLGARLGPVRSRAGLTAAGAALLLLVGSANGVLLAWQSSVQHRITHTLTVDRTLMQVLADLLDSETGQRGYLLTGDPAFLVPYTAGQARIAAELPVLDAELRASPTQEARLRALRPAIDRKFAELDRTLALDRAGDRDGALALVRAGEGKAEMDGIRRIIESMRAQEDDLLVGYQRHAHRIEALVGIGSVVSVGIMALLAVLALRETARGGRPCRASCRRSWRPSSSAADWSGAAACGSASGATRPSPSWTCADPPRSPSGPIPRRWPSW